MHFRQLDTAEENNIVGSKMHDNRTIPVFSLELVKMVNISSQVNEVQVNEVYDIYLYKKHIFLN